MMRKNSSASFAAASLSESALTFPAEGGRIRFTGDETGFVSAEQHFTTEGYIYYQMDPLYDSSFYWNGPAPTPTPVPTPVPTPIPTPAPVPTPTPAPPRSLQLPSDPQSPYGIALRENLIQGVYYSDEDKVTVVGSTFNNRHKDDGSHMDWYRLAYTDDLVPGYRVELYYAGAIPMKLAAQTIADGFAVMPRGELDFDLGTDIRMNAVEAEPRLLDQSGAQGTNRVTIGWRLGEVMEEPDPPVLEALAGGYRALTAALETNVLLDVHKGILLARCDTDPDRAGRVQALRALEQDPAALEAFWLEQDLLGLELAPDEYAAFIQEATPDAVAEAARGTECDAILLE